VIILAGPFYDVGDRHSNTAVKPINVQLRTGDAISNWWLMVVFVEFMSGSNEESYEVLWNM
jgi:hypothetical protein